MGKIADICHVNRDTKAGISYTNDLAVSKYARREQKHEGIDPMVNQSSITSLIIQEGMLYHLA